MNQLAHVVDGGALHFGAEVGDLLSHVMARLEQINANANILSVQGFVSRGTID